MAHSKIFSPSEDHKRSFRRAAYEGNLSALRKIAKACCIDPDCSSLSGWSAVHLAAKNGKTSALAALIQELHANPLNTKDGMTLLHMAAQNGHVETCRWLASQQLGIDVNARDNYGSTALHAAGKSCPLAIHDTSLI